MYCNRPYKVGSIQKWILAMLGLKLNHVSKRGPRFKKCNPNKTKHSKTECIILCHIDGLVQDGSNSNALAMELLQSCTKPSMNYNRPQRVGSIQKWILTSTIICLTALKSSPSANISHRLDLHIVRALCLLGRNQYWINTVTDRPTPATNMPNRINFCITSYILYVVIYVTIYILQSVTERYDNILRKGNHTVQYILQCISLYEIKLLVEN